jgi:mannose-1-phosphate guanylyltransferase
MSDGGIALPRRAMLLAAGRGTRLRPLTDHVPKCMVPVHGTPVLARNIAWLRRFGVTDLVINLHYRPQAVIDYFGDGAAWGVRITYSLEEELLGTAGAVKQVADFFQGEPFFLWYGDNLSACDLRRLYALHRRRGSLATVALFYREDPTASGIVGLDADGRIRRILEKPRPDQIFSHWVNAGIFVLEPQILDMIPPGVSDFGHDVLPDLLAAGAPLYGYHLSAAEGLWWIDTPADLERIQREFALREASLPGMEYARQK